MSSHPKMPLSEITELGTRNLRRIVAMDSQSDERSESIPSTEGQRQLSAELAHFFAGLGLATSTDAYANLLVTIPASAGFVAPKLALLIHMDTCRGTCATSALTVVPTWDGARIPFADNRRLEVSLARYPETRCFLGEDVLCGPGRAPFGLDDKLGLAELMTLAQVLVAEPEIPHGELVLICRPDEEIGRMAAVESLAEQLADSGVRYGYTVDGIGPFEVQVENFEAARARVSIDGKPLPWTAPVTRRIDVRVFGCKSHGATAKAEGYLNATVLVPRALELLGQPESTIPIGFQSDIESEVNADVSFLMGGADDAELERQEAQLLATLTELTAPHSWRGAGIEVLRRAPHAGPAPTDEVVQLVRLLLATLASQGPSPLLSEESEGRQGYSNPCFVQQEAGGLCLEFRLRAFDPEELRARERHVCELCAASGLSATVEQQYKNMAPALAPYPELVHWARDAAAACGVVAQELPIRGGTGVDPFLAKGIPIANLGTGYFAPESEKELTSRQKIGQHVLWLVHIVQQIAASK